MDVSPHYWQNSKKSILDSLTTNNQTLRELKLKSLLENVKVLYSFIITHITC